MMLANDLKTYYDEVRRYLDCPKDEQDRLLLSVNKQVIELQVDNPNLDYDGIVEFLGEPESLAASLMERLSPDVIQKFRKRKRRIRTGIMSCAIVAFIAMSVLIAYTTSVQSVPIKEENTIVIDDDDIPSMMTKEFLNNDFYKKGIFYCTRFGVSLLCVSFFSGSSSRGNV